MALDRLTIITSSGLSTVSDYVIDGLRAVGVVTASTVQVGAATTVHTTGVDLGSGNITSHNINSTGIITATGVTVTGDLTVEGTLAYDDVTNIDSVGIITARDDIKLISAEGIVEATGATGLTLNASHGSAYARIRTAGSERLRITSAGNIGIASDIPAARLDVYKNFSGVSAGSYAGRVYGTDSGVNETGVRFVTKGTGDLHNASDAYLMHGISNGTTRFVFGANGKVGIGTDNPSNKLEVLGTSNLFGNGGASVQWGDTDYVGHLSFASDGAIVRAASGKALIFHTNHVNERLRITSTGSVGIGTNNPALRAHIFSTANADAALIESTQNFATLRFKSALNSSGPTIGIDGAGGLQLDQKDTSKYISFAIGTDRLRIASNGRIGVNNTSPNCTLDIKDSSAELRLTSTGQNRTSLTNTASGFEISQIGSKNIIFQTNANERLRITYAGDVNIPGGILNLGTADVSSGHINSYELMSFNIDTDNDDGNRYFIFKKDGVSASGTELMRLTEGGNLGIGGVDPATGDGGNSNYNNWDIPKLHVRGSSGSGKFHLLGRFHAGNDSDGTGAQIVIHHENDRGMALQGGRSSGNRSYGAIKSLDNLARESNVMVFTGGSGQGVENIKFFTNGGSTGTNERMSINTHGTVHTGGSTEITQTTLKPDLITQAGVVSPMFYRPFQSMTGAPSTSGPGYVDFGTGGVRHNLTDPHLGASYGGAQFQGGLIGSYSQTFSNTASGSYPREAMNWNRIRLLFRGLCLSTGHTPPTVKFRYSTYHYSNGWQDHSATEWSFSGTEQARGARWVVGPWINPSSIFTGWADVPGFGLYYNDNSSGKTFRIAGGVYYQYAHFI